MRLVVRQGCFFLFGPTPDLRQHQLRTISYDSYATQLTFHWKHDPSSDWKSSTPVKWKNKSILLLVKEGHCWRIGNHKCSPSGSNITWLWLRSCLMVGAQVAAKIITEFSESTKKHIKHQRPAMPGNQMH